MTTWTAADRVLIAIYKAANGIAGKFIPDEAVIPLVVSVPTQQVYNKVYSELVEQNLIHRTIGHVVLRQEGKEYFEQQSAEWQAGPPA